MCCILFFLKIVWTICGNIVQNNTKKKYSNNGVGETIHKIKIWSKFDFVVSIQIQYKLRYIDIHSYLFPFFSVTTYLKDNIYLVIIVYITPTIII